MWRGAHAEEIHFRVPTAARRLRHPAKFGCFMQGKQNLGNFGRFDQHSTRVHDSSDLVPPFTATLTN